MDSVHFGHLQVQYHNVDRLDHGHFLALEAVVLTCIHNEQLRRVKDPLAIAEELAPINLLKFFHLVLYLCSAERGVVCD